MFTKQQIAIIGVAGLVILLVVLIFTGVIPGLREKRPEEAKISLTFWGIFDSARDYDGAIKVFNETYPEATVTYRGFTDPARYETELLRAFAAGTGPDVFMVSNTGILKNIKFAAPMPREWLTLADLSRFFPDAVLRDFVHGGRIYALPVSIDTLALIYNRDSFNRAGIINPPQTWSEFQEMISKLSFPAAAIGGYGNNILTAADILSLLLLQAGAPMTSTDFSRANFSSPGGVSAFEFYLQFSNPRSAAYGWNQNLAEARELFARGGVAMIFDYHASITEMKARNPLLNFGVAKAPQQAGAVSEVNYASYWGYAVSVRSRAQQAAWYFIRALTLNERGAASYLSATGRPPALRSLISSSFGHPELDTFARQALTARSWQQVDSARVAIIFSAAIEAATKGELKSRDALRRAETQVTEVLRDR